VLISEHRMSDRRDSAYAACLAFSSGGGAGDGTRLAQRVVGFSQIDRLRQEEKVGGAVTSGVIALVSLLIA
jgi:hypothetical protein